jgi:hypothetical protein
VDNVHNIMQVSPVMAVHALGPSRMSARQQTVEPQPNLAANRVFNLKQIARARLEGTVAGFGTRPRLDGSSKRRVIGPKTGHSGSSRGFLLVPWS